MNPNFWFNIFVLALGWPIVIALAKRKTPSLRLISLSLVPLLAGVWGYTNFTNKHGAQFEKDEWYHHSEMWQYYLGSKYYQELGNTGLYDATLAALKIQKIPHQRHPVLSGVRDLERVFRIIPEEESLRRFEESGLAKFSPERWKSFLSDVKSFHEASRGKTMMLLDMGYNPPPPYSFLVGMLSNAIPINSVTLNLMASLDWILVVLCGWMLGRTFGPASTLAFLLVFLTNPLANWGWVGGAYLRNLELTLLTTAICMMHRHRMTVAGAFLGLATSIRVFPAAFFVAALVPFLGKFKITAILRPRQNALFNLATGFGLVCFFAFSITVLVYGWSSWSDFLTKIWLHSKILFVYHIGFDKLVMPLAENAPQYFDVASSSGLMLKFQNWLIYNSEIYDQHWFLYGALKMTIWTVALLICTKLAPANASLFLGELTIFLFALPANYYYMTLALFATAPFLNLGNPRRETADFAKWLPFVAIATLNVVSGFETDGIVVNANYNWIILGWLVFYMMTCLPQPIKALRKAVKSISPATATLVIIVSIFAIHPRTFPSTNLDFPENIFLSPDKWRVAGAEPWTQYLPSHTAWTNKNQLLMRCAEDTELSIKANIPMDGIYRIHLDYTTAPDYVEFLLISVAGKRYGLDTASPSVEHKTWESPPITLAKGELEIKLNPKSPESSGKLIGVSSLYIVPD